MIHLLRGELLSYPEPRTVRSPIRFLLPMERLSDLLLLRVSAAPRESPSVHQQAPPMTREGVPGTARGAAPVSSPANRR